MCKGDSIGYRLFLRFKLMFIIITSSTGSLSYETRNVDEYISVAEETIRVGRNTEQCVVRKKRATTDHC